MTKWTVPSHAHEPMNPASGTVRFIEAPSGNRIRIEGGDPREVGEAVDLFMAGAADIERRRATIAGDRIGYFVTYVGPQGFGSLHMELRAPGLVSFDQVLQIQHGLSQQAGGPIVILDWRELDAPPRIVAPAGPIPPPVANT